MLKKKRRRADRVAACFRDRDKIILSMLANSVSTAARARRGKIVSGVFLLRLKSVRGKNTMPLNQFLWLKGTLSTVYQNLKYENKKQR